MKLPQSVRHYLILACTVPALWLAMSAPLGAADTAALLAPGAYVTGGIGEEERTQMQAVRAQYNLQLIFALAKSGQYVSQVDVSIKKSGSEFEWGPYDNTGPWFFVQLEPGTYRVSATYDGVTQTQTVRVRRSVSERVFYWPAR